MSDKNGWSCTTKFRDGLLIGTTVEVPPGEALTARRLQQFQLGQAERDARTIAQAIFGTITRQLQSSEPLRLTLLVRGMVMSRRRTPAALAAISALYVEHCATSAHPAADLARMVGIDDVKRVYDYLRYADLKGFLDRSSVVRGTAGGRLTDLVIETLQREGTA